MSGEKIGPAFQKLSAREELRFLQEYPRLLPRLLGWGLSVEDALALAHNATLLWRTLEVSPPLPSAAAVLERYSLDEIAELCSLYRQVAAGELEYGEGSGKA